MNTLKTEKGNGITLLMLSLIFILFFVFFFTIAAFSQKKNFQNRDLNRAMKDLETAMSQLKEQDWSKISENALKSVDMDKIQQNIEKSLKEIDFDKISLSKADTKQIKKEIDQAMKDVKSSMEEIREINKEEIKKELNKAQAEIAKARIKIEQNKIKISQMKEMLAEMEKDGLIKKGEKVNIKWENDKLYINGKEQSEEVSRRYKKYSEISITTDEENSDSEY